MRAQRAKQLFEGAREEPGLHAMAAAGAVQGFLRYYARPELTAKRGWFAIGAVAVAHELICPQGELLSEGCDRAFEGRYGLLTKAAIGYTALHLMNLLPEQADMFHQGVKWLKG